MQYLHAYKYDTLHVEHRTLLSDFESGVSSASCKQESSVVPARRGVCCPGIHRLLHDVLLQLRLGQLVPDPDRNQDPYMKSCTRHRRECARSMQLFQTRWFFCLLQCKTVYDFHNQFLCIVANSI